MGWNGLGWAEELTWIWKNKKNQNEITGWLVTGSRWEGRDNLL